VEGDPLGGPGAGNGNFNTGEAYVVAGDPPAVVSITRASANPTAGLTVDFTVMFDEAVTGVDTTDFVLTTTGTIAGASVVNVAGTGATRTVTVSTGTGTGTIRLDVVGDNLLDSDTILSAVPLAVLIAGIAMLAIRQLWKRQLSWPPFLCS